MVSRVVARSEVMKINIKFDVKLDTYLIDEDS